MKHSLFPLKGRLFVELFSDTYKLLYPPFNDLAVLIYLNIHREKIRTHIRRAMLSLANRFARYSINIYKAIKSCMMTNYISRTVCVLKCYRSETHYRWVTITMDEFSTIHITVTLKPNNVWCTVYQFDAALYYASVWAFIFYIFSELFMWFQIHGDGYPTVMCLRPVYDSVINGTVLIR